MSQKIVFFDIPGKDGRGWSPNPEKGYLTLRIKGLPFETRFVEYPDIKSTLSSLGAPPADPDPNARMPYTCPAIIDPSHSEVPMQDSWKIAEHLDRAYPNTTPLFPRGSKALATAVLQYQGRHCFASLGKMGFQVVASEILGPRSSEYFFETRQKWFGVPLDKFSPPQDSQEHEDLVDKTIEAFGFYDAMLKADDSGPFLMGETVSFGDVIIVSMMFWIKRFNPKDYDKIMGKYESFKKQWDAFKPWLQEWA